MKPSVAELAQQLVDAIAKQGSAPENDAEPEFDEDAIRERVRQSLERMRRVRNS